MSGNSYSTIAKLLPITLHVVAEPSVASHFVEAEQKVKDKKKHSKYQMNQESAALKKQLSITKPHIPHAVSPVHQPVARGRRR